MALQFGFQFGDTLSLGANTSLVGLIGAQQALGQVRADDITKSMYQFAGILILLIQCQAETETELGVILEERIVPRRPSPLFVERPGSCRQVTTVDAGT